VELSATRIAASGQAERHRMERYEEKRRAVARVRHPKAGDI